MELLTRRLKLQKGRGQVANIDASGETGCTCRCLPYQRAYREDLGICVDDIHGECALRKPSNDSTAKLCAPFRGGSRSHM